MNINHLPSAVRSGGLGAGGTGMLNPDLANRNGLRIAAIVQDMSEADPGCLQAAALCHGLATGETGFPGD